MSKFVHMELNTSDVEGAKAFYGDVFGWTFQDMEMHDGVYAMVEGVGGVQQNPMPDTPSHWLGYIGVESLSDTITSVERNGGKVIVPKTDVDGMGMLAVFIDPQGAVCAIWQPAAMQPTTEQAAATKKAGKKKAGKKAPAKKASKKAPAKKASKKVPAKKKASKKAPAKKKASKKAPAKKAPAKKASKKTAKKKTARKK